MNTGYPDNNPKTQYGIKKAPLQLVPPSSIYYLAEAFADGARKYGPYNWRDKTVSSSVYVGAAKRHIDAWWDGEELSSDARVHHIAHAMACLSIILDAMTVDKLNDDRPTKGAAAALYSAYSPPQLEQEKGTTIEPTASPASNKPDFQLPDWYIGDNQCRVYYTADPASNALVSSGVPDVQADLFPQEGNGNEPIFRGYDGQYEYWEHADGGVVRYDPTGGTRNTGPTVSELFRGGEASFSSLYDLTERDGGGTIPLATRDGNS